MYFHNIWQHMQPLKTTSSKCGSFEETTVLASVKNRIAPLANIGA